MENQHLILGNHWTMETDIRKCKSLFNNRKPALDNGKQTVDN